MKVQVRLIKRSNHGQAGDVVSLQKETASLLVSIGAAESLDDSPAEPIEEVDEEVEDDDSGDESGQADGSE